MLKRSLLSLIILMMATIFMGCGVLVAPSMTGVADAGAVEEGSLTTNLGPETVKVLLEKGEIIVVDVRQPSEYERGHIPGSLLIPLDELDERLQEIPEGKRVVTVCRSGSRSSRAKRLLVENGLDNVHNMSGGMIAWERAGFDIER